MRDASHISFVAAHILLLLVSSCQDLQTISQDQETDSLGYFKFFRELRHRNLDSAQLVAQKALELGFATGDSLQILRAKTAWAYVLEKQGKYDSALILYKKALAIASNNSYRSRVKFILNRLGITHGDIANYSEALNYHLQSLKLRQEDGDLIEIATTSNNIGLIYYRINDNHQAIQYFQIALNVKERANSDVTATLINLAHSYRAIGKDDKAFSYYEQVIVLCQEYCEPEFLAGAHNGAGLFHFKKKDLDKAKYEFEEAVKVSKMHGLPLREVIALHNLSKIALQSNNIKLALDHVNESQSIALSYGYKNWIRFNYKLFGAIYFQLNSFELAYEYQNKSDSLNEIIEGSEVRSKIAILEREVQEKEKAFLREKEAQALKSRDQLFIGSSAGIVFLGGLVFFFYRSNRFRKRANKQISKTLKELKTTQHQLVAQEKMAALGQRVSGIVHEINTPLGAIQGLIQPVNDHFAFVTSQLNQGLKVVPEDHHTLILELMKQYREEKPHFNAQEKRVVRKTLKNSLAEFRIEASKLTIEYLFDIGVTELNTSWEQILKLPNHEAIVKIIHSVVMHERGTSQMESVVNKIAKMVSALQTYSQPERSAEVKVAIDLRENIDQVLVLLENEFKKGVKLIKNYPERLTTVQGNPEALSQVWTNLFINAIQAVEGKGTVEVEIEETAEQITVSIKDDGYGIRKEDKDKIFEAFYTTKERGYGTGLGLNIVRKIVSNHKGKIELVIKEGQTLFKTNLPKTHQTG